jgi:hypothetical protein
LQSASVVFADEVGVCVSGKLRRFHTVGNELLTYIFVRPKRVGEASLLPVLQGYAVQTVDQVIFILRLAGARCPYLERCSRLGSKVVLGLLRRVIFFENFIKPASKQGGSRRF